ncbi:MAG: spore coat protein [Oscillospiraceae bacterium]|nr:spore coat protein [Oscillospiraceae bacterium]
MANLTEKELSVLEDSLNEEQLLVKKYQTYAQMCSDPTIKSHCEQMAGQHRNHFNRLVSFLN